MQRIRDYENVDPAQRNRKGIDSVSVAPEYVDKRPESVAGRVIVVVRVINDDERPRSRCECGRLD